MQPLSKRGSPESHKCGAKRKCPNTLVWPESTLIRSSPFLIAPNSNVRQDCEPPKEVRQKLLRSLKWKYYRWVRLKDSSSCWVEMLLVERLTLRRCNWICSLLIRGSSMHNQVPTLEIQCSHPKLCLSVHHSHLAFPG